MIAARFDIDVEQGATFADTVSLTNADGSVYDLTGFTASAQVRLTYSDSNILLTLATSIDVAHGTITFSATKEQTAAIDFGFKIEQEQLLVAVWDLFIVNGENSLRILKGLANIHPRVTR